MLATICLSAKGAVFAAILLLFTIFVLFVIMAFVLPLPYLARILSSNILTSLWSCAGWFYKCLVCSETPKMGFSPKSGNLCAATTKCTDQTMRKHMLICAFAVCIWQNKFCLLKSELSSSETRGCVLEQNKLILCLISVLPRTRSNTTGKMLTMT